jgi:hypothetical protein
MVSCGFWCSGTFEFSFFARKRGYGLKVGMVAVFSVLH